MKISQADLARKEDAEERLDSYSSDYDYLMERVGEMDRRMDAIQDVIENWEADE